MQCIRHGRYNVRLRQIYNPSPDQTYIVSTAALYKLHILHFFKQKYLSYSEVLCFYGLKSSSFTTMTQLKISCNTRSITIPSVLAVRTSHKFFMQVGQVENCIDLYCIFLIFTIPYNLQNK